jgi:hypothetical protein
MQIPGGICIFSTHTLYMQRIFMTPIHSLAQAICLLLSVSLPPAAAQVYNSILISEIMADPTPTVGLPDAEYLELYNRGAQSVSLKGWRLHTGNAVALLPDSVLAPGGFVILCSRTRSTLLSPFGRVIGLSSFSLPNDGTTLILRNNQGSLVHSVAYRRSWWPSDKRAGGYALEMVDTANPCAESGNWKASLAPAGGTPGRANSASGANPDLSPPRAERAEVVGDSQINVYFNERLDSVATIRSGTFDLKGRAIRKAQVETPSFRVLSLFLDVPLAAGQRYDLTVQNVSDCVGLVLKEAKFALGLPVRADSGDVILNEILYDPRTGGVEFAEIHNRTPNYISLKNWTIGNVRNGQPASFRTISSTDLLLAPYGFAALTTLPRIVQEQYPTEKFRTIIEVPTMPSFSNINGGVALRNAEGKLFDLFEYDDRFHSPLLANTKGVSLERIFPERQGNDPRNWQSAAGVAGYATPGYANSQGLSGAPTDGFTVEPEAFTPDGDGVDDYATIRYTASATGRVASIRIYDVQGRLVRSLIENQTIGTAGSVEWEGNDDRGNPVRMGYYLVLIDLLEVTGNSQRFKKRIVLVRP